MHSYSISKAAFAADNENIKKLLCSIALNPNASAVLFVGLGCENNGMDGIKEYLSRKNEGKEELHPIGYFSDTTKEIKVEFAFQFLKDSYEEIFNCNNVCHQPFRACVLRQGRR